jgi:hypothetical protein
MTARRTITHAEWLAEGERRFGTDKTAWRFVCPACGHVASVADWKAAGAPEAAVAFSCVGRWTGAKREAFGDGKGPCNYTGGGLFALNPVTVSLESGGSITAFELAEEP